MLPFWIALQFLSSLPIRLPGVPAPQAVGRSLLFYPLVGALFSSILMAFHHVLEGIAQPLHAAMLLVVWVLLSGGLHLDGLADSADAWLGGFGDRERTLAIMKDPRSGPIAVVALVLVLLLKFTAILTLLDAQHSDALLLAPVIGRAAMLGLFLGTPYVRTGGLGQALADHLPRRLGIQVLAVTALGCVLVAGWCGVLALLLSVMGFFWLRRLMLQRLGGSTGDTAGAMLELLEMLVLVTLALI